MFTFHYIESDLIRAFNLFASKDKTRPALNHMMVFAEDNGRVRIGATDGRIAIMAYLPPDKLQESKFPDFHFPLPTTKLKGFLTVTVTKPTEDKILVKYTSDKVSEEHLMNTHTFPRLTQVFPEGPYVNPEMQKSGVSLEFLGILHSAAKLGLYGDRVKKGIRPPVISFESPEGNGTTPLMVRPQSWHDDLHDAQIVVMPYRLA